MPATATKAPGDECALGRSLVGRGCSDQGGPGLQGSRPQSAAPTCPKGALQPWCPCHLEAGILWLSLLLSS